MLENQSISYFFEVANWFFYPNFNHFIVIPGSAGNQILPGFLQLPTFKGWQLQKNAP
jgi:hypothetical protein